MTRLRLARSLPLVLLGLTVTLAIVAGATLAALHASRTAYENRLAGAYGVDTAASDLLSAQVVREAVTLNPGASKQRIRAADNRFAVSGTELIRSARSDPPSAQLARRAARGGDPVALIDLARRQTARRATARSEASQSTRRTTVAAGLAAALALVLSHLLSLRLIDGVRRPLDGLVIATGRLAHGALETRVDAGGASELRELAQSFNVMAAQLEDAHRRLDDQQQQVATVIESLGDALLVCDGAGLISQLNPRAHELLPEVLLGEHVGAGASPLPGPSAALGREREIEHHDRVLAITAARLGAHAGDGFVYTVRDVSERARLERMKSEFVATASHELRSPLTSIKGFVELLEASPSLTPKQRDFVEIILLSTNRLTDLVSDLLDVAQVESGRLKIVRRPVALGELVEEVAVLMRPRLEHVDQTLVVDLGEDLPHASADPIRIRQVVMNLLTNAHLYTPAGGRLSLVLTADDTSVSIGVSDTGRGMDAGELERVFDRFYRAGELGTGGPSGSGLGLSIVRSLVDLHDGTVSIDSEPGVGTTFTVAIPRAVPAVCHAPVASGGARLAGLKAPSSG